MGDLMSAVDGHELLGDPQLKERNPTGWAATRWAEENFLDLRRPEALWSVGALGRETPDL